MGLLITIQSISAQEVFQDEPIAVEEQVRPAEQVIVFGDNVPTSNIGAGPSIWAVVRMIFVLALAAAAIYGAVYFIKRFNKQVSYDDSFLKVLATSNLGANRYVHVVYVGNKAWLVGASDGGVNVIGEIDDKDTINAMLLDDSKKASETPQGRIPNFLAMLKKFGAPVQTQTPGADEIRKRRERLKGL